MALAVDTLNDNLTETARHSTDSTQLILTCRQRFAPNELEDGRLVLWTVVEPHLIGLCLNNQFLGIDLINGAAVDIEDNTRTKAQRKLRGADAAHICLAAGVDGSVIVGLDTFLKLSAIGNQGGVTVQPQRAVLKGTVEL